MFRKEYAHREHKCAGCLQYLMMAASPLYLHAHLNILGKAEEDEDQAEKSGNPLVEDLLDDLLEARFGIVVQKEKRLTDAEVDDWFGEKADSELAVQYANGKSLLLLLCRQNGLGIAHEVARFHNRLSELKVGKPAIYVSKNIVEAQRDVRLHFPEFKISNQATLEAVRQYAMTHVAVPLVRELAALRIGERHDRQDKKKEEEKKSEE